MAVPFYVPDHDEDGDGSTSNGHSPNTTTSATQTPLQSPVSGEHLVQAFCEALYRCSINNGTSGFQFPPPSPSCSINSPHSGYSGGDIFFPRGRSTPRTPRTPRSSFDDEAGFFRQHQQQQQSFNNNRINNDATVTRRSRLTSTGDDDNECHSEHETSWDELEDRYENYAAARERLQEFPGRIPPRKKKKDIPKSKPKLKEQSFTWPTVVTVFVFAMGCGFLVAR